MTEELNLEEIKDFLVEVTKEAGAILQECKGNCKEIRDKGKGARVTEADIKSENHIIKRIKEKFSNHSIHGEETGREKKDSEYEWFIDGLDGTNNYIHQLPAYGVMVALAKNGKPLVGAIYLPEYDEMYYAVKGKGAFRNGKKLQVPKTPDLHGSIISIPVSLRRDKEKSFEILHKISDTCHIRWAGCSAFEFAHLASGHIDGIVKMCTNVWDVAIGCLLAEEAGAELSAYDGSEYNIHMPNFIVSNRKIHKFMVERLKDVKPSKKS